MRILLTIILLLPLLLNDLSAQNDFLKLDQESYHYYMIGDYNNLKKTADTMFTQGFDYYYLRMRLGILSYKKQIYSSAQENFNKAIAFNSLDTISREYVYYSYLLSGRVADANLYLNSIPAGEKNLSLKSLPVPGLSDIYGGSSVSGSDVVLYKSNSFYYESVKSSFSVNAGIEGFFLNRFKGTVLYTNYRKWGTYYSATDTAGTDLNFTQNQVYARLTGYIFPGWEFSGFGHVVFYPYPYYVQQQRNVNVFMQTKTEYTAGVGIAKNWWRIRAGADLSVSNFSNSSQMGIEGYLVYLPHGNTNLYFTSGGMYQSDSNWGNTYQINQEIGLRINKSIWLETGITKGNSFLYNRNFGCVINNSFQIPATSVYSNLVIMIGKHFNVDITPFYSENNLYSWNLNSYTRNSRLNISSFGCSIKLNYKNR